MDDVKNMRTGYKLGLAAGSGIAIVAGGWVTKVGTGMMINGAKTIVALVKNSKEA